MTHHSQMYEGGGLPFAILPAERLLGFRRKGGSLLVAGAVLASTGCSIGSDTEAKISPSASPTIERSIAISTSPPTPSLEPTLSPTPSPSPETSASIDNLPLPEQMSQWGFTEYDSQAPGAGELLTEFRSTFAGEHVPDGLRVYGADHSEFGDYRVFVILTANDERGEHITGMNVYKQDGQGMSCADMQLNEGPLTSVDLAMRAGNLMPLELPPAPPSSEMPVRLMATPNTGQGQVTGLCIKNQAPTI